MFRSGVLNAKPPPVLTKRIAVLPNSFPVKIVLDDSTDTTIEGQANQKWKFGDLPLLLSVRYDEDGTAATRSPNDLIGQATVNFVGNEWENFDIAMGGRGIAGKFITNKIK